MKLVINFNKYDSFKLSKRLINSIINMSEVVEMSSSLNPKVGSSPIEVIFLYSKHFLYLRKLGKDRFVCRFVRPSVRNSCLRYRTCSFFKIFLIVSGRQPRKMFDYPFPEEQGEQTMILICF